MTPILKWAGGKRWLASILVPLMPKIKRRYIEPFVGGGAIFFALKPKKAVLSDINIDLINMYRRVREKPEYFSSRLKYYQDNHSQDFYYSERSRTYECDLEKAAQLLYFNRTCFNGLYRVNLRGQFNVPIGTKKIVSLPTDDFDAISSILDRAELWTNDFEDSICEAEFGDLVYADPPYTVQHNMNGFRKYNDKLFEWEDQIRLKTLLDQASARGAYVMLSNADHESIESLYGKNWNTYKLLRTSRISGKPTHRGPTTEVMMTNFCLKEMLEKSSTNKEAIKKIVIRPNEGSNHHDTIFLK